MPCLHPITIKNKRYEKLGRLGTRVYCKKYIGVENCRLVPVRETVSDLDDNFGWHNVTEYDIYPPDEYITVPCGRCAECRKSKRLQWSVRLIIESRSHLENIFLTLTLDDKHLNEFKDNPKRPLQLYIDRLRKYLGYRPKYFFIPELGEENGRLHYHGIIFDTSRKKLPFELTLNKWLYGHAFAGYCNDRTCNYVVKYLLKGSKDFKPFIMCSNGIGKSYLNKKGLQDYHINGFDFRDYIKIGNTRYPLPVYYRDKIYSLRVKAIKMINRLKDESPFEKVFHGITYRSEIDYYKTLNRFYDWSLTQRLSEPLPKLPNVSTFNATDFDRVEFLLVNQKKLL